MNFLRVGNKARREPFKIERFPPFSVFCRPAANKTLCRLQASKSSWELKQSFRNCSAHPFFTFTFWKMICPKWVRGVFKKPFAFLHTFPLGKTGRKYAKCMPFPFKKSGRPFLIQFPLLHTPSGLRADTPRHRKSYPMPLLEDA